MKKSKGLTFFLSFIPGAGHLYLGLMNRGLQFLILFFGTIFISNILISGMFQFLLPVIWLYCLFDALQQYNKIKESNEIVDIPLISWDRFTKSKHWFGWILIILGVYLFVEKLIFETYGWQFTDTFRTIIFSLMLILIGIYMLFGKKINRHSNKEVE